MVKRAYSPFVANTYNDTHAAVMDQVMNFVNDLGEDCDVILEYDDPEGPYALLFSGTSMSLSIEDDIIHVLDFDFDNDEETILQSFEYSPAGLNRATSWLLTQVNQANPSS